MLATNVIELRLKYAKVAPLPARPRQTRYRRPEPAAVVPTPRPYAGGYGAS